MNLSKKEKIMLSVLGIVLIGVIYYQFIYANLVKAVDKKAAEEHKIETKYSNAIDTINSIESQKSKVKILNSKITEKAKPLYPTISQEHIILELDKLIKDSGLATAGMEFELVELNPVDVLKKSDKDKGYLESTMQASADKYNNKFGEKKDKEKENKSQENNKQENINNKDTKSSEKNNTQNPVTSDTKENKVIKMKGKIKFYGTYESLVKFVKLVGEYDKKICLYGIGMDRNNSELLKGEIGVGIYSIPKINDDINEYLKWTINNSYGKKEPFQLNQVSGTGFKYEGLASDFNISAKPTNSELPTIMIGKSGDTLRNTYIYADGNNKQKAEIVFTQAGDKFYYKYKTDNGSMPVKYEGNGSEFTPFGKDIVINIASGKRGDSEDNSGLKLNIINDTNKLVMVNVKDEDEREPRISIDGDNKKISVSQK